MFDQIIFQEKCNVRDPFFFFFEVLLQAFYLPSFNRSSLIKLMRYLKWIALLRVYFLKFLPINLHGQAALAITVANNMNATHSDHNYFAMHRRRNAKTPSTTALWSHDQAVDHQSWNMVFLKVFQEDLTSKQTAKSIIPWPVKAAKDQWKPLMWQYDCSVKQIIAGSNVPQIINRPMHTAGCWHDQPHSSQGIVSTAKSWSDFTKSKKRWFTVKHFIS